MPRAFGPIELERHTTNARFFLPLLVIAASACDTTCEQDVDAASIPEACRATCDDASHPCAEMDAAGVPSFETTKAQWTADCQDDRPPTVEGACANGAKFLRRANGPLAGETRFFDRDGAFQAVYRHTDAGDTTCFGQTFWPAAFSCPCAHVTESLCGDSYAPGDPLTLWLTSEALGVR